jgi:hypothetical protein
MSCTAAFLSREQLDNLSIITFSINNTFQIPQLLLSCDTLQFEKVLSFASKLLDLENDLTDDYKRNILFAEYLKTVEERHSTERLEAEKKSVADMSSSISPLISKISDIERSYKLSLSEVKSESEQQIKASQKVKAALESELQTTRTELEVQHQRETKAMAKRISELEAELQISSKSESLIRERCQQESDRLLKAIEQKNAQLIAIKEEALEQREQRLVLREQELQTKIQRQSSSVLRGHDGEHFFANIAKEKMNWDLVKAPTFSCDYSSTINNVLSLFEIKNYTNSIPQAEVTKFVRDMKMHPEALIGIFISLNTPIQGRNPANPIAIEWIHGSQCVVYIQSCADLDIDYTFAVIDQLIKITGIFNTTVSSQSTGSQEAVLQSRIDQSKSSLDRVLSRCSKLVKKISADKKQQIELIEANSYHSITEINMQMAEIVSLKELLLGEYTEPEVTSEPVILEVDKSKKVKQVKGKSNKST